MGLTKKGCRERQNRLVEVIKGKKLDGAIVSRRDHIYYFTGFLRKNHHSAAFFITADGETLLIADEGSAGAAVEKHVFYTTNYLATLHSEQHRKAAEALKPFVKDGKRYGSDLDGGIAVLAACADPFPADITADIYRLRKRKLADEVGVLKDAIGLTEKLYDHARRLVRPGLDEVDLYSELVSLGIRESGGQIEDFGNDFRACDSRLLRGQLPDIFCR